MNRLISLNYIEANFGQDEHYIRITSNEGDQWNSEKEETQTQIVRPKSNLKNRSPRKISPHKLMTISQTNYQHIQNQKMSQIILFDQLK